MKKKILFAACAWLMCLGHAWADELTIGDVTVPQGGTAELTVGYAFTSTTDKVGFTFSAALPDGLSFVKDEDGDPVYVKDATSIDKLNIVCAGEGSFAGQPSNASASIKGTSGTLLTLTLQADAALAVGSTHTVSVTKVTFQKRVDGSVTDINLPDFTFTVTIGEPADTRTVLDENATTAPTSATGVDVRVKRTIKACEWSTICLPFAMTAAQVKATFGDDVQIGDFKGYEATSDDDENVVGLNVKFEDATAIEANHPYIIKVSSPISEFTVDGVDIDPEDEPTVAAVKRTKKQWSEMIGTYVAGTELEATSLFLSGNQFWYSAGSTKMKAYRAYFDFYDVLTEVEDKYSSRISFSFDESTGIQDIEDGRLKIEDSVYDLQGRRINYSQSSTQKKGMYIVNGKKIIK